MTKTVLGLLCSDESESLNSIMPLLLRLANKILTGTIAKIQNQFYAEFDVNKRSIRLFERMHAMISRNIFIFHRHHDRFAMDPKGDSSSIGVNIDVQAQVIKFLKALCEKHNTNLQLYMAEQKNSRRSYNMISILVLYLDVLIKEIILLIKERIGIEKKVDRRPLYEDSLRIRTRMKISCKHAILTLKALTESIQGPCLPNQSVIADSQFYAIAESVMNIHFLFETNLDDKEAKVFNNLIYCKLKSECATLMLNLMEQRNCEDTLIVMMKQSIPDTILMSNIQYVYYAFTKETDSDYTEELLFPVISMIYISIRMMTIKRKKINQALFLN